MQLGEFLVDVIEGLNILLSRGAIMGGAAKLTVSVLFSSRQKEQVGLVERLLKRKAFCRFLIDKFPIADPVQAAIVSEFNTFPDYHANYPAVVASSHEHGTGDDGDRGEPRKAADPVIALMHARARAVHGTRMFGTGIRVKLVIRYYP